MNSVITQHTAQTAQVQQQESLGHLLLKFLSIIKEFITCYDLLKIYTQKTPLLDALKGFPFE